MQSNQRLYWVLLLSVGTLMLMPRSGFGSPMRFPVVDRMEDEDRIVEAYTPYLNFVLAIGREVDRPASVKLYQIFSYLRKQHPVGAAKFLKGLRFELDHKVDLMGKNPYRLTSSNPHLRSWVRRFIRTWVYEADEHLFRARGELALRKEE